MVLLPEQIDGKGALLRIEALGPAAFSVPGLHRFQSRACPLFDQITLELRQGADYESPMRLNPVNHSPSGFEWDYGGGGPAQLALAILADCLKDRDLAVKLYESFKLRVTSLLPHQSWTLCEAQVRAAVAAIQRDEVA